MPSQKKNKSENKVSFVKRDGNKVEFSKKLVKPSPKKEKSKGVGTEEWLAQYDAARAEKTRSRSQSIPKSKKSVPETPRKPRTITRLIKEEGLPQDIYGPPK